MSMTKIILLLPLGLLLTACDPPSKENPSADISLTTANSTLSASPAPAAVRLCDDEWNAWVERAVGSDDGQGHGPDIGSAEWQHTITFRLKLTADNLPPLGSQAWCQLIDQTIKSKSK